MRRMYRKCRAIVGATALILLVCASSAGAVSGLLIRPAREFTATGTLRLEERPGISCNVTLRGSFSTTLVGISGEGSQIGGITGLSTSGCSEWAVALLGLPWPLRVDFLSGDNPRYAAAGTAGSIATLSEALGWTVRGCLHAAFFLVTIRLTRSGTNEYTAGAGEIISETCAPSLATFELAAPSPRQTFTFLAGGEVINGPTPNPLDFGTVRVGELVQRPVTIGSTPGGRIEEITVASGRYFAITDPNECRGRTLAAHGTCTINAILSAPTEAGRAVSDTLTTRIGGTRYEGALRATT